MSTESFIEANVRDLVGRFPRPVSLSEENHVGLWPLCDHRPLLSDKRGSLFTLCEGWSLVGWCQAPFPSRRQYNDALVLEFDAIKPKMHHADREAGIYWIHCRLEVMNFRVPPPPVIWRATLCVSSSSAHAFRGHKAVCGSPLQPARYPEDGRYPGRLLACRKCDKLLFPERWLTPAQKTVLLFLRSEGRALTAHAIATGCAIKLVSAGASLRALVKAGLVTDFTRSGATQHDRRLYEAKPDPVLSQ